MRRLDAPDKACAFPQPIAYPARAGAGVCTAIKSRLTPENVVRALLIEDAPLITKAVVRAAITPRGRVRDTYIAQHGDAKFHTLLYFASTSLIAATFPADRPSGSKLADKYASAMSLASSAPMTRAPIVMICALFDVAAFPAE